MPPTPRLTSTFGASLKALMPRLRGTWRRHDDGVMPRWAMAALAFAAITTTAAASRAGRSRVALVRPAEENATVREAITRMRAELAAAGFDVVEIDAGKDEDPRASVEAAPPDA